jgi:hypothetical protein
MSLRDIFDANLFAEEEEDLFNDIGLNAVDRVHILAALGRYKLQKPSRESRARLRDQECLCLCSRRRSNSRGRSRSRSRSASPLRRGDAVSLSTLPRCHHDHPQWNGDTPSYSSTCPDPCYKSSRRHFSPPTSPIAYSYSPTSPS